MDKNYVFNSNKKLLHVYICCARPNGRTVRHIRKQIFFLPHYNPLTTDTDIMLNIVIAPD